MSKEESLIAADLLEEYGFPDQAALVREVVKLLPEVLPEGGKEFNGQWMCKSVQWHAESPIYGMKDIQLKFDLVFQLMEQRQ